MSNKVLLKKSSVLGKAPIATDLDYGELALNYADGLLYFKNANNNIQSFAAYNSDIVTLTATQTLTNKTLTSPTLNTPNINGGSVSLTNGTLVVPSSASPSQTDVGSIVYDTGFNLLTVGNGSGRRTIVDTSTSQTLTNKTLTAASLGNAVLTGTLSAGASAGTNGQYLKSTGTGVVWDNPVAGPSTATANAIARYNSTTGKLIKNSGVTIDDTGAIVAPVVGSIIPFYYSDQSTFPNASSYHGAVAHSHADGKMFFAHSGMWMSLANSSDLTTLSSSLATVATTGSYTDLINKPTLFSGSYTDLTNQPTIPSAIFSTIAVTGQTSLTAGSSTATLNVAAGTGITLSTTPGTNTLTITGTSSYTLGAATTTALGGVIIPAVGTSGITNTSGTIGLATASTTQLGAVKVDGSTISISGGIISVVAGGTAAAAGTLTGTTLSANVVNSSLTSVGTLANLTVTNPIAGSVTGNAGSVTNGVYTTVSYPDPAWITSLASSKVTGLAASATTDTTNATNISSGTLGAARLPTATTTALGAVKIDGTSITITNGVISAVAAVGAAAAGQLTGTTLAANVVTSSLTTVGTLTNLTVTNTISGSISGSAGSVPASGIVGTVPTTSLPKATTTTIGAVRVDGSSITIDANGIISSTGGGGGTGSGTVNTGTAGQLAYYASSTTAVSPLTALNWNSGTTTLALTGTFSATTLSGALAASNLTGTIAAARLPIATTTAVGGVKVDGTSITIVDGVISAAGGGGGGSGTVTSIASGNGLSGGPITTSGTLSIDTSVVATLNDAQTLTNKTLNSPTVTGTINAGGGVGTSGQVLTSTGTGVEWTTVSGGGGGSYTLPIASPSILGGIKIGSGLQIAGDGTVAVTGASGSTASGVVPYDFGYITETVMTMQDHGSIV